MLSSSSVAVVVVPASSWTPARRPCLSTTLIVPPRLSNTARQASQNQTGPIWPRVPLPARPRLRNQTDRFAQAPPTTGAWARPGPARHRPPTYLLIARIAPPRPPPYPGPWHPGPSPDKTHTRIISSPSRPPSSRAPVVLGSSSSHLHHPSGSSSHALWARPGPPDRGQPTPTDRSYHRRPVAPTIINHQTPPRRPPPARRRHPPAFLIARHRRRVPGCPSVRRRLLSTGLRHSSSINLPAPRASPYIHFVCTGPFSAWAWIASPSQAWGTALDYRMSYIVVPGVSCSIRKT